MATLPPLTSRCVARARRHRSASGTVWSASLSGGPLIAREPLRGETALIVVVRLIILAFFGSALALALQLDNAHHHQSELDARMQAAYGWRVPLPRRESGHFLSGRPQGVSNVERLAAANVSRRRRAKASFCLSLAMSGRAQTHANLKCVPLIQWRVLFGSPLFRVSRFVVVVVVVVVAVVCLFACNLQLATDHWRASRPGSFPLRGNLAA